MPSVATLSNDGFVIAWRDQSNTGGDTSISAIRAQRYDSTGTADGSEFLVNTTTANIQSFASVAGLSNGGFVIAWTDGSASGGDTSANAVRAQRYDSSGTADGGEFLVNTTTTGAQALPNVAAFSGGGFVVAWHDASASGGDTSGQAVRAQRYDSSGATAGSEFLVNTTTANGQNQPSVATLSDGGFVIAWRDASTTGGDTSSNAIRAQRYDSTGATAGSEFLVNTTTTGSQASPSVAGLSNGGFVIAWHDASASGGDTSGNAIRAQRYDSSGATVGSEFLVNSTTSGDQTQAEVAARSDGGFIITWVDASASGGDTSGNAVRGQAYDSTGAADGAEFLINTTSSGDQDQPSLAIQSSGTLMMAGFTDASSSGGDTTGDAVRAQLFTVQAATTTTTTTTTTTDGGNNADGPGQVPGTRTVGTTTEDRLLGTAGQDTISGGVGGDTISGGAAPDRLHGGEDGDSLHGDGGNDVLYGNLGGDAVYGNEGTDTLYGGQDDDTLLGGDDWDALYGNRGDDALYGNEGLDTVSGGAGSDTVYGGKDGDVAYGNLGEDAISGNLGDDTLYGGQGGDTLHGGAGDDQLIGGLGADRYVFTGTDGADTILGFSSADGDVLEIAADINGTGIASPSDLLSRLTDNGSGNTLLDLGSGNTVTLLGISAGALSAGDFLVP